MIKNNFIDLRPTSRERIDAVNTLRYTLFLDHEVPGSIDQKDFMCDLMKKVQLCCSGLFVDDPKKRIYYDFFGSDQRIFQENKKTSDLAHLDSHMTVDDKDHSKRMVGFHDMILQHCVLSSYHAIMTELSEGHWVTSYRIEKSIKGKGIHALCKENSINFTDGGLEVFKDRYGHPLKEYSGKASDLLGKTETHIKVIPDVMGLLVEETERSSYRYRLQFSRLCHRICEIDARRFRCLNSDVRNGKTTDELLDAIELITDRLEPKVNTSGKEKKQILGEFRSDPVDGLYHYYITERIFNLSLFWGLVNNIICTETQTHHRLCQKSVIEILTTCKELPNVFSRQYFLKYAFDKIKDEPVSYMDFWFKESLERIGTEISEDRMNIRAFDFSRWLRQYKLFMRYMSRFVIPVYEWCFINMLLGSIEKRYPDKSHIRHLEKAVGILSDYMNENYGSILQPIQISERMDMVDIISKHKNIGRIDLPVDSLKQIMDELFKPDIAGDQGLNLRLLNPSFFDNRENGKLCKKDHNYEKVRRIYIELLWGMCME